MVEPQKAPPSLEEIYRLTKDNNRMLKAMRRDALIGGIFKMIVWILLVIVVPYVIYVTYLAPYLDSLQSAYQSFNQSASDISSATSQLNSLKDQIPNWGDFLNKLK